MPAPKDKQNGDIGLALGFADEPDDYVDWRPLRKVLAEVREARAAGDLTEQQLAAFTKRAEEAIHGDSAAHKSLRRDAPVMVLRAAGLAT